MYAHAAKETKGRTEDATHWVSHQFQLHIGAWHEVKVLVPIHQHHSVPGSTLLVEKETMVITALDPFLD